VEAGEAVILALLAILIVGPVVPNPALTPGVVRPISRTALCRTRWGKDARHVTLAMRRQVFAAYRIPTRSTRSTNSII
jgi:hypothetical protein